MRGMFALVVAGALADLASPCCAAAVEAGRECPIYSLEGVRIGVTLEEVRAAQSGAEFSRRGRNDGQSRQQAWRVYRKWKEDACGVDPFTALIDGRVEQVHNEYRRLDSVLDPPYRSTVERATLNAVFAERFGAGLPGDVERDEPTENTTDVRTAYSWDKRACDRFLSLHDRVSARRSWPQADAAVDRQRARS